VFEARSADNSGGWPDATIVGPSRLPTVERGASPPASSVTDPEVASETGPPKLESLLVASAAAALLMATPGPALPRRSVRSCAARVDCWAHSSARTRAGEAGSTQPGRLTPALAINPNGATVGADAVPTTSCASAAAEAAPVPVCCDVSESAEDWPGAAGTLCSFVPWQSGDRTQAQSICGHLSDTPSEEGGKPASSLCPIAVAAPPTMGCATWRMGDGERGGGVLDGRGASAGAGLLSRSGSKAS